MEKGTDDPLLATLQESIGRVVEIETDRGEIIRGILENAGGDRAQIKTAAGRIIFIRLQRIDRCEIMNGEAEENSPASPFQQGPAAPAMRPESAQPAGGNDRPAGLPLDIERESSSPEPASQQPGVSLANACPPVEPSQPAVASPLDGHEADHQGNGAHAPHAPTPFSAEVMRRQIYIAARIDGRASGAQLAILDRDIHFRLPEEIKSAGYQKEWDQLASRYQYALKVNELAPRFGRIQLILSELEQLIKQIPHSAAARRHYAFLRYSSNGNGAEALSLYKEVTFIAPLFSDWYNLAVLALKQAESQPELACYALTQAFRLEAITSYMDAWYVYINLLKESDDYTPLHEIYRVIQQRGLDDESQHLLEAAIYLLQARGQQEAGGRLVEKLLAGTVEEALREAAAWHFTAGERHRYQQAAQEWSREQRRFWEKLTPEQPQPQPQAATELQERFAFSSPARSTGLYGTSRRTETSRLLRGNIFRYHENRWGFLQGDDQRNYFFHRSAISDDDLLAELERLQGRPLTNKIPVTFQARMSQRGPFAIDVARRRDVQQIFALAQDYANEGEYEKACAQARKVLDLDPEHAEARECYQKWLEFARASGVPRGSNPYARAKRKQLIEKDLEGAIPLFREAIRFGDTLDSAVKDLAALLMQLNRPAEAIEVLQQNRHHLSDKQRIDNLLVDAYYKAGQYQGAITLLRQMLSQRPPLPTSRQAQLHWRIAICYLKQEHPNEAERAMRQVLKLEPDNRAAQRNLALCLLKQGRTEEAEALLRENLSDPRSVELLDTIIQARESGQEPNLSDLSIEESALTDFSSGSISKFADFFLSRCKYEGIDSRRLNQNFDNQNFDRSDLSKLENLASTMRTYRPRERAEYYLSAARIVLDHEEWEEYQFLHRYLCRSFASRGDAAIIQHLALDTARECYCEALRAYDCDRSRPHGHDEQDAINALVRFLYSTLSREQVPSSPKHLGIDDGLQVLLIHKDPERLFDALSYLLLHSHFAASRLLPRLHDEPQYCKLALEYLQRQGITIPEGAISRKDFSKLWDDKLRKEYHKWHEVTTEISTISSRLQLTAASIEDNLKSLREVEPKLLFEHDRLQLGELRKILETLLSLSQETTFEEQERLCMQIDSRCKDLGREIEANPTRLLIEHIYPLVTAIQDLVSNHREQLYRSSKPQLTLRLPKDMESYALDSNSGLLEVQLVIENKLGCSPAEAVELVCQEDSDSFRVKATEIKLEGSLRGGEQRIKHIPLQVTPQVLQAQAFSLPVYAQYRTRQGERQQTSMHAFSINLYSADSFEDIKNPYAAYASGSIVRDEHMFYGRSELIANIAAALGNPSQQSTGIVIFGQKRSGKTSILYHLKQHLQRHYTQLLVIDMGSVGSYMDEHARVPLLYQLLGGILHGLQTAVEDEIEAGRRPALANFSVPEATAFYAHPTPLPYFQSVLNSFQRAALRSGWGETRIVLLLDEFSYIYSLILKGRLSEDFMKNWKAFLQQNLFSVVLAGQDVMPKFKAGFPNEFAAFQDQRISYLRPEDARRLIDEPIHLNNASPLEQSRYREKAIESILNLTACSPYYIQIFCSRLVEYMNRKRYPLVTQADVEQVKNELILGANALDESTCFDNLLSSGDTSPDAIPSEDARAVLSAIALNSRTGPCTRESISVKTEASVDEILKDLTAREVIETRANCYTIRVGLFKEWLLAHP
ncbi:tetratricopeptide repeat protein [Thermogemmatispora aurantia]|uniref:tetratricopeptide repeat protein n=1 Tax=Thermogemmatispora aurantia TaxID=2045279 RepID=UPI00124C186E|nr:tetratricopeptide repeat protein [Thermogemmatispora aurantia]